MRRAAREIGEQVSCDARYIGRVEAGQIRCPNYAYERVFRHMFPHLSLTDMGFAPRESVRGRTGRRQGAHEDGETTSGSLSHPRTTPHTTPYEIDEESDVLRRAFMTGGSAAVAAVSLSGTTLLTALSVPTVPAARPGPHEATAVERAVRQIRLLDDQHGADSLYQRAAASLRTAQELLAADARQQATNDRLRNGAGELAISVGWLAHDSGRFADARSHYAEALATARMADDPALEAHAFSNTAFLARDAERPWEAVRAAQAGQTAAKHLGSPRLLSLLTLREAGGWAGLGDRRECAGALSRAHTLFGHGASDADPEWMTFFGAAELWGLEAQCWSLLGDWSRATSCARRAVTLQDPHFVRNQALFTAELAVDLAGQGAVDESATTAVRSLELLGEVRSTRVRGMLDGLAQRLAPHGRQASVADFLSHHRRRIAPRAPAAEGPRLGQRA